MIERNKQTMKRIAVTYDNGQVFQHFGRTEAFKVYEVEDGNVVNSEIVESNGVGHGALAVLLNDNNIDVVIKNENNISKEQAAQIKNIVSRELKANIEDIHITTHA